MPISVSTVEAITPPISWARMYGPVSRHASRPAAAAPSVTAGLKCPPEIGPKAYTPTSTASPTASATARYTPDCAPGSVKVLEANTAVPMAPATSRNVPSPSATRRAGNAAAGTAGVSMGEVISILFLGVARRRRCP